LIKYKGAHGPEILFNILKSKLVQAFPLGYEAELLLCNGFCAQFIIFALRSSSSAKSMSHGHRSCES